MRFLVHLLCLLIISVGTLAFFGLIVLIHKIDIAIIESSGVLVGVA